jgi:hypothetical protein
MRMTWTDVGDYDIIEYDMMAIGDRTDLVPGTYSTWTQVDCSVHERFFYFGYGSFHYSVRNVRQRLVGPL